MYHLYHSSKIRVKPSVKMADLIDANPSLLLMLQHFNIDFRVSDQTVQQLCIRHDISESLFVNIANLYNGFSTKDYQLYTEKELIQTIDFLKNTHDYYRSDKYPQISSYIRYLKEHHPEREIILLENFFNDYFVEVLDHLAYEENVAFPYFLSLLKNGENEENKEVYSCKEYSEHHTDIELKLKDLKNLLLKYVKIDDDLDIRRKLFFSLYELEFDLYIHSLIEETILIPSGMSFETHRNAK